MFQLAQMIAAPIVGEKLHLIGGKNAIIGGFVLEITATLGFGFISYFKNG
jgi:phage protein U